MAARPPTVGQGDGSTPPSARPTVRGADRIAARAHRLTPRELWKVAGPGIITGAAGNDPAGITTYSVVGAQNGFAQNWLLLLSTPLLIVVQQMSARIGNVTKTDLASLIRLHFGRRLAVVVVLLAVIANIATIGADLVMMASVTELLTGINFLRTYPVRSDRHV